MNCDWLNVYCFLCGICITSGVNFCLSVKQDVIFYLRQQRCDHYGLPVSLCVYTQDNSKNLSTVDLEWQNLTWYYTWGRFCGSWPHLHLKECDPAGPLNFFSLFMHICAVWLRGTKFGKITLLGRLPRPPRGHSGINMLELISHCRCYVFSRLLESILVPAATAVIKC